MLNDIKVSVSHITKQFDLYQKKSDKVRNLFSIRKKKASSFWALKGITFQVKSGEALGIIGTNGSGKSTLANIIAGILPPTTGSVKINGETSIISIGAGLKPQLTGIENIRLKAIMSGMSDELIKSSLNDIISFAEIGDFINQPVKSYSSGMKARLGFAIAVHKEPDVLIIDEALSVGDETFYRRCIDRIMAFKAQGKTIIFVSHSIGQVRNLCDKVAWIQNGDLRSFGPAKEVLLDYSNYIKWYNELSKQDQEKHNEKQKNLQKIFCINQYYQESLKDFSKDQEPDLMVKTIFFKNSISERMSIFSIIMLALIIVGLIYLYFLHVFSINFLSFF